jgi:hypothetical protein
MHGPDDGVSTDRHGGGRARAVMAGGALVVVLGMIAVGAARTLSAPSPDGMERAPAAPSSTSPAESPDPPISSDVSFVDVRTGRESPSRRASALSKGSSVSMCLPMAPGSRSMPPTGSTWRGSMAGT